MMATLRRYVHQFGSRYCVSKNQQLVWLAILSSMCLFVYYQLYVHFTTNHLENEYFVGATKCPACFGVSLCKRFSRGEFHFHSYSSVRLLDFVNLKNVYYATYLDQKPVVMKKLGHNSEHNQFDRDLCTNVDSGNGNCDVSQQIYKSKLSDIMYAERLEEKDVMGLSDLVRCPSRRLLDRIWDSFGERQNDKKTLARDHKLMLATTLAFNPEPLILQAFPNRKGWPFPVYMGACGRFTVQEYSGHTLSYFYTFKFNTRAALAIQVLKIAEQLTENRDEFALYLTDVSEDNLAVNANGEVLIIDAENIIVVDRRKIKEDANPGWDVKHQSEHLGCGSRKECIMFSHTDLCNHYYSDHNYYAVCQGLFSKDSKYGEGGLLHSIPSDLSTYMKAKVKDQIAECRNPSTREGRYLAVKQLKETLMKLIS